MKFLNNYSKNLAKEEITEISRGLGLWDNSVLSHMESQFATESWNLGLANHLERTVSYPVILPAHIMLYLHRV